MSESVNSKVVIFWIIFIFVFAGLALFGMLNQDLIENKDEQPFIPVVNSEIVKSCTATVDRGSIRYDLILSDSSNIKNTRIIYTANNGTIDDYAAATSLYNSDILGLDKSLQNEYTNFTLMLMYQINSIDMTKLSTFQSYVDELNIVINNNTSVDAYVDLLNDKYGTVQCVDSKTN